MMHVPCETIAHAFEVADANKQHDDGGFGPFSNHEKDGGGNHKDEHGRI